MTKKELIKALRDYDDDIELMVCHQSDYVPFPVDGTIKEDYVMLMAGRLVRYYPNQWMHKENECGMGLGICRERHSKLIPCPYVIKLAIYFDGN